MEATHDSLFLYLPPKDLVAKLCRQKGLNFNNLTYTTANRKTLFINSSACIVMKYIDIHRFASDEERARALIELIGLEPPPGRYIRHMFFKIREAAKIYSSVQELQDSINRILQMIQSSTGQDHGTVDFSDEPLTCYYGDIYRENFPVDLSGNLWVVDFDITGVLPASFASWPLDTKYKHPLPIPIQKTIPLGTSKNLKPMFRAYRFNQMSAG
ncbi:hypothetical protein BDV19DRAFT_380259 [Aspergillus venezuelensis]